VTAFAEDDFTRAGYLTEARWVAELADGRAAYGDDGRPGCGDRSAWLRLGDHLRATGGEVAALWLEFRSHRVEAAPRGAPGYMVRSGVVADFGTGAAASYFVAGHADPARPGVVVARRWGCPDLTPGDPHDRAAADPELVGESLLPGTGRYGPS
jgi:hypothetical protein